MLGGALIAWTVAGTRTREVQVPVREEAVATVVDVPKDSPTEPGLDATQGVKMVEHEIRPDETYEGIARYYGVSLAMLQKFNTISLGDPPVPGTKLKMMTNKPPRSWSPSFVARATRARS